MAEKTFYFYDLETTGLSSKKDRIMQFAGQRTNSQLEPIGEPDNIYIKITKDILPSPDAVLVTGITPQKTLSDGISEAEFLKYFYDNIAISDTVFVGYNSLRFDDEFIRNLNYRNFYDAYEWQWSDGRSRWDMLDVVRMTRALRPEGIEWPFNSDGKPSNKLEFLTQLNKLGHDQAHDALSDVLATIAVAKLIRSKNQKLFEYLFKIRSKKEVDGLVSKGTPFIYSSGRYEAAYNYTTAAAVIGPHPTMPGAYLVYDLRYDPKKYAGLTIEDLQSLLNKQYSENAERFPVKIMHNNKCPAIAPLGVMTSKNWQDLSLTAAQVEENLLNIATNEDIKLKITELFRRRQEETQTKFISDDLSVDDQLYDGFFDKADQNKMRVIRAAETDDLVDLSLDFDDPRLKNLLTLYKARQYPAVLNDTEQAYWNNYCAARLNTKLANGLTVIENFFKRLEELAEIHQNNPEKIYLLEELQLYAQSIMQSDY
jgi:exodeoxyribonuclease-1